MGHMSWAYAGYWIWLLAGLADFLCHRRTDLPHTSGLDESRWHLVQMLLIGTGVVLALAFEATAAMAALLSVLVASHMVFGYLDTRVAFRKRAILPVEQHVHSILDLAPIIALCLWWFHSATPDAHDDYGIRLRQPLLPPLIWTAVLAPSIVLCALPAALEFAASWRARTVSHDAR